MAETHPGHPWVDWADFVEHTQHIGLSPRETFERAKQKFKEIFGTDPLGIQVKFEHANNCTICINFAKGFPAALWMAVYQDLNNAEESTPESPAVREMMESSHKELVRAGDKVLKSLPDEIVALLGKEDYLQDEWRDRFSGVRTRLTLPRLRAALAVSEVSLALETLMSSRRSNLDTVLIKHLDAHIKVGERQVPVTHLVNRIAEEAAVEPVVAQTLWNAITKLLVDGKLKLPGLASAPKDSVELCLERRS